MLDQPFGKDNIHQTFTSEAAFRHILLPLFKSLFLSADDWYTLCNAYHLASTLDDLLTEYSQIDFRPLRGYQTDWNSETEINEARMRMTTAAVLFWDGNLSTTVRWIGGSLVGAHRDTNATLAYLKPILDPETHAQLATSWTQGVPTSCNASASEANFQAFRKYGNHSSTDADPSKTYKTVLKDNKKGYCITMDHRLIDFILHAHVTPQGLVDLNHPRRNPRPISDCSFHPEPWCHAINDWTNKDREGPVTFAPAFMDTCIWLYNLRISYPHDELYLGDDDISGAFRHLKYHPNLVPMHCFMLAGFCCASIGMNFGGTTSPSNFDVTARARRQLARHLWHNHDIIEKARPYLPEILFAVPPNQTIRNSFQRADPDSINTGTFDPQGNPIAPPFPHHVDDCTYAHTRHYMLRTISASVISLFEIFGYPSPTFPTPLSIAKFEAFFTHHRRALGRGINTRSMTLYLLPDKRKDVCAVLTEWIESHSTSFTLQSAAIVAGTLENISELARWSRPWFYAFRNALREALTQQWHIINRKFNTNRRRDRLRRNLPSSLLYRLNGLIARDKAKLLWSTTVTTRTPPVAIHSLRAILTYLSDESNPWQISIGHYIPRVPHIISYGDASTSAGGAFSPTFELWFDIYWNEDIVTGTQQKPSHPGFIHINCLEFIVMILEFAAISTYLATMPRDTIRQRLKCPIPAEPVVTAWIDNTSAKSWTNKISANRPASHNLCWILAELLRPSNIGLNAKWIPGKDNTTADLISRPPSPRPTSHSTRRSQIFRSEPKLQTWTYFLPSPELRHILKSALSTTAWVKPPLIPKTLGHVVTDVSTISTSPSI